jgi:hypothetical protein
MLTSSKEVPCQPSVFEPFLDSSKLLITWGVVLGLVLTMFRAEHTEKFPTGHNIVLRSLARPNTMIRTKRSWWEMPKLCQMTKWNDHPTYNRSLQRLPFLRLGLALDVFPLCDEGIDRSSKPCSMNLQTLQLWQQHQEYQKENL